MEKDRPFVLPWSSQNQIYGDLSKLSRRFPSLLKNQISTKYKDSNAEYKFGLSNKIESYWDRKIFGQLTSKSGDLRNNQGLYKLNILSFSELPKNDMYSPKPCHMIKVFVIMLHFRWWISQFWQWWGSNLCILFEVLSQREFLQHAGYGQWRWCHIHCRHSQALLCQYWVYSSWKRYIWHSMGAKVWW